MVEGDAENILLPVIANIIGYPLEKYGISIVNVGSTAFLCYSCIMVRHNGDTIGVPVSVITDCNVKPYELQTQDDGKKSKYFQKRNENPTKLLLKRKQSMRLVQSMHLYRRGGH
ncbi:MAG: ATP-dependent endonuclease [Dysosmobacter sp.]|nr:ATP-dependent endonuclease [Dysosmobacter sp.]